MPGITPIPTTRVSDQLAHQRLLTQLRIDQLDIQRLQTSISTGRRIFFASEDAPAGMRAISLQRLLERKAQVGINLQSNQAYLSATDSALAGVSGMLNEARGTAVGVASTTSTQAQREVAATEIQRVVQQLVDTGNHQFRGRHLFTGSRAEVQPFEMVGNYVRFNGNEKDLLSYSDIDLLFETNVGGADVFGAISKPVLGTADMNPIITANTRLADLRGGLGISDGSILISDGTNSSSVDVSSAETVGDVMALLEANPPAGRAVSVTLSNSGLNVSLDAAGGGNWTIKEVGGGTTVSELGLLRDLGLGAIPITGTDLNPKVTLTTPLNDILGTRAQASVVSTGVNNDLVIRSRDRGPAWNGWTVNFVDDGTVVAGSEVVTYDTIGQSITVNIDSGATTAGHVMTALQADAGFNADFTVALDTEELDHDGTGPIELAATGITAGGGGIEFDQSSGLQILNGGETFTISLASATTVEDVLNILNGSGASLVAGINAAGTGIDVRSRLSGSDFAIGENGGTTATDLGLRTFTGATRLEDLGHGRGVHTVEGTDFTIRRKDGVELEIDVSGADTIDDVLNLINTHASNLNPATRVTAQLAAFGNGIELVTSDAAVTAQFAVLRENFSNAGWDLGLIPRNLDISSAPVVAGGTETLTGADVNPLETEGVFNSLIRIRDSLRTDDLLELERSIDSLDEGTEHINYVRGEIGARQQSLDVLEIRLGDEEIELKSALSEEIEVDLAEAISNLVSRQAAYEASLAMAGQLSQLTLLDFL